MKYVAHIFNKDIHNEDNHQTMTCDTIDECLNRLMTSLYNDLGNGDNENCGSGSLWNCAPDIYKTLKGGGHYSYAEMEYWMTSYDEKKDEKVFDYLFRMSAVVDNNVHIEAKSYADALEELQRVKNDFADQLKTAVSNTPCGWDYDGNVADEGYQVNEIK